MRNKKIIKIILFLLAIFLIFIFIKNRQSDLVVDKSNNSSKFLTSGEHKFTTNHDGLKRFYYVYVPSGYEIGKDMPVVVTLHGGGGTPKTMPEVTKMNEVAEEYNFIVVYPGGTNKVLKTAESGLYWNSATLGTAPLANEFQSDQVDDVGFIELMLQELENNFSIDTKRIYVTGISNGGFMSYHLAAELEDKIAAIAPVAAVVTPGQFSVVPDKPIPIMHFHGTDDLYIPYNGGFGDETSRFDETEFLPAVDSLGQWAEHNNCNQTLEFIKRINRATLSEFKDCRGRSEIFLWTLDGGGHTWPGGYVSPIAQTGRFAPPVGEINSDINASEEMWLFFKKHSL